MSEFFERQRQEAEKRRLDYKIWRQEQEINSFSQRVNELEQNGYDDGDLWAEIDALHEELREVKAELKQLKEAK